MESKVLYTDEIDDLDEAVTDLFEQAEDFELKTNSLAVVMTEEETDYPELYAKLSERWKFPFIGCTTMAMLVDNDGYCGTGISVMLLTADDCEFAAGATGALNVGNYRDEIAGVYKPLSDKLGNKEKLIISYGVLAMNEKDVSGDDLVKSLDTLGKGIPVFGGLASDGFNYKGNRVFCNDKAVENGMVIALVSGNVKPMYITVNSIENRATFSYEITESRNNQIFRLGGGTFIDALRKEDIAVGDKTEVMGDYLLSPFIVTVEQPNGEKVEVARNLSALNYELGSGLFLGAMPEGSYLGIGIIKRDDVQVSVNNAFDIIAEKIRKSDYHYSTILCTTCAARFLALASNIKAEGDVCSERLPEGFSLLGMYAYGEFCPVKAKHAETEYNMFHNYTFTIMAL